MMSKAERETMDKKVAEIAELQRQLTALRAADAAEIDKLKKEVEQQKGYAEMYSRTASKAEQEVEAAHALIDGLPNAPARETEAVERYQRKDIPLTTRLATWIARVAFGTATANREAA